MKLRINAKLRAALIAAIATVGFTLPQAQADEQQLTGVSPTSLSSSRSAITWNGATSDGLSSWRFTFVLDPKSASKDFFNLKSGSNSYDGYHLGNSGSELYLADNSGAKLITLDNALSGQTSITLTFVRNADATGALLDTGTFYLYTGQDAPANPAYAAVSSSSTDGNNCTSFRPGTGADGSTTRIWTNGGAQTFSGITLWKLDDNRPVLYTWAGTDQKHDWSQDVWNNGEAFGPDGSAKFTASGYDQVDITTHVEAQMVSVEGQNYTFNITGDSSLTTGALTVSSGLSVTGTGALAVTNGLTIADGGSLTVGADNALKLGFANAGNLLQAVQGAGDIHIAADTLFAGSSTSTTPATTRATGALVVDEGKTLKIGTTNTGAYVHTYVDMKSFNEIRLDGSTLWVHNDHFELNNLTVTEKGGTVTISDTQGQDYNTMTLKGTTQLDGTLTFNGTWKQQFTIEALNGTGTLNLAGSNNDKQIVNIGGGTVGVLQIGKDNVVANITGNLAVGGLTGTEGTVNAAQDLTFDVAESGEFSYSGTLTVGGQVVKKGLGSQSIGAYEMHKAMDVQAGTLVLNGAYSIDYIALDPDSEVIFYDNEGNKSTSGFRNVAGAKTVYTVAEGAVVDTTTGGASFTVGGQAVELSNGKYVIAGTTDYTTLWVNSDELAYDDYHIASEGVLATAKVAGGATLTVGTNAVGTLEYQTNGTTITLAGTGTVNAISGTGILNMAEGARVSVSDVTVSEDRGIYSTGKGTLVMSSLFVDSNASRVEFDSATEIALVEHTGGTITFGGEGNTHSVTGIKLSMRGGRASTVNVAAGATLHITGTEIATAGGGGSFAVSHWNSNGNTVNVSGTLISEAIISGWDGAATINVENGGTLELRAGLNRNAARDNAINVNVKSGATLVAGTATSGTNKDSLHVNLNGGSTLKGYYGSGDTATIAKAITFGSGSITMDVEAGKTLQIDSSIAGEGVAITKTGDGALVLNGGANVLYNALNVQAGTVALNGAFDLSHITHEQGTVKYYMNDQPGTEESANGFAKYVGEVQLVTGHFESVTQGPAASLTLDGYSVTYDTATGKAKSGEISLATFYINQDSESVSTIVAVAPEAGVTLADGAKLVVDAELTGAISVRSGRGLVQIEEGQTLQNTGAAIELSGSGTYALAAGSLNKGGATLGQDWDGYLRITNFTPNNGQNLGGLGSALELNGFRGWDSSNWAGTMAMDIKLTDYVEGDTTKVAWSCGAFSTNTPMPICTFTGAWSGTGTFKQECDASKYMGYEFKGNIADWTGAFITTCKTTLTFSNAATDVNIAISKESGTLDLVVNNAATFTKSVAVDSTAISTSATFKNTASLGAVSGAGAITVDAGEGNTVTINGHSGLANTITLTSGTLSLNGAISISDDMPVDGSITYSDGDNGFRTVEGKLQIVGVAEGAILSEGEGNSYIYGGKQIATSLNNGAIALTPTTSYETYYVNQGTASLAHAIQGAAEHDTTLTGVVMADGTTLTADGGSSGLVLADGASATVETTAASTISSLTGPGEGKTLTLGGTAQLTIQNPNAYAGTVNVQSGANVYLDGTTSAAALAKIANDGTLSVAVGNGTQIAMTNSTGTLAVRSGQVDYRSTLGGQTLELGNATLLFGNKGGDNTHTYAGNIVVSGNATVTTYGTSQHPTATISGSVTGNGTLTRNNDGNQTLYFTGGVNLGGYTNSDAQGDNLTDFQGATNLGTLTITTDAARTKFSHADTVIGTIAMNTNATVEIAGNTSVGAITGNKDLTLNVTNDATATLTGTSSFNKLISAGKVVVAQGAGVTLANNLTPNSGTVEILGTVNVNNEVDLSNGGNSTGIVKVGSTGVVNVKEGMWMAKSASVALDADGAFNIAGLSIVGRAGGSSITTTADNGQYGTNNGNFVITNAAVTGTTDINLGNKLVNSTLTTGVHTMTLNNAESTYDAVYVSEGGSLVVNADVNLAGVLHSSGAITVNADKSLTLTGGSSLFQTVANSGTVSLTGVTLGAGFQEQQEGSAYYGLDGVTPVEATDNHYEGTATTYVQVVNGGTSSGSDLVWNEKTYDLNEAGRIIVSQGSANYDTFYVTTQINSSTLIQSSHYEQLGTIVVTDWAELTLDEAVTGKVIEVQGGGFITGTQATPESVAIAAEASAIYNDDVTTENGVTFSSAIATVMTNTNEEGAPVQYSTSEKALAVTADTMTMNAEADVTVSNQLVVDEIVNETGHKLTLDNTKVLELKAMTIGADSTVEMLFDLDEGTQAEGTVTITEALVAGGGTLLANLTIADVNPEDGVTPLLNVNGGGDNALTLGSQFTIAEGTLVTLDNDTIRVLEGLKVGQTLDIIRALEETDLTYGEGGEAIYDGMWFDALFARTTGVEGDYRVYATEDSFGLRKVSNAPEPATGTLSLLALAALAARRRRH